jgi:hypothetical protein
MLTHESQNNDNDNNTNQPMVRSVHQRAINSHQIVKAALLYHQHKMYSVTISVQGCNPIVVDSTRRLKGDLKLEWIVNDSNTNFSHYLPYAPHNLTFFDFIRQKSIEAKKLKQECFCLFHFRRGYFGFIIQCKVESVSKRRNLKQSVRLVKVYQTQSVRYYGPVQHEANKYPAIYGATLYYLLKDCVIYNTFYISLSTKRKRNADDDESEDAIELKKAKKDHQCYSCKQNDSNLERHPTTFSISREEEEEEEESVESQETQLEFDNPSQCRCTFL